MRHCDNGAQARLVAVLLPGAWLHEDLRARRR
jgi:hypothetical protein